MMKEQKVSTHSSFMIHHSKKVRRLTYHSLYYYGAGQTGYLLPFAFVPETIRVERGIPFEIHLEKGAIVKDEDPGTFPVH